MSVHTASLAELRGTTVEGVEWDLVIPDYAHPEAIQVDTDRVAAVANVIGCDALRVVGEAGEVSTRVYGGVIVGNNSQPRASDTFVNRRNAHMVRTVVDQAGSIPDHKFDWVIFNTNEITDIVQADDYKARGMNAMYDRAFGSESVRESHSMNVLWARLLDIGIRKGLRELANERTTGPLTAASAARVHFLTRQTFVSNPRSRFVRGVELDS